MSIARTVDGLEGAILIDANGAVVTSGGGSPPPVTSQALAYLARTVGGNEGGNGTNVANLIDGLVADGVWSKLDCLYVLAQQNETDAKLNLIGTSYTATNVGTPNFTAYQGFYGFAISITYLNTNFNPATATSPNFTQNSASFGFWAYAIVASDSDEIGNTSNGSLGESNIFSDYTGGNFYARVTNGTIAAVPDPGTQGLYVGDRSSSASVVPYWNGMAQATQSGASQSPNSSPFTIGWVVGSGSASEEIISAAFIGASLGSAGQLALYNRLRTYMTAVGVP